MSLFCCIIRNTFFFSFSSTISQRNNHLSQQKFNRMLVNSSIAEFNRQKLNLAPAITGICHQAFHSLFSKIFKLISHKYRTVLLETKEQIYTWTDLQPQHWLNCEHINLTMCMCCIVNWEERLSYHWCCPGTNTLDWPGYYSLPPATRQ